MLSDAQLSRLFGSTVMSLNAPYGAPRFLTCTSTLSEALRPRLNAPYDALCFLMIKTIDPARPDVTGVNAPYGAPCFLMSTTPAPTPEPSPSLNAPYGAPCFLTEGRE